MNASKTAAPKTDLAVTHVLAQQLERLEHSAQPVGADQYRSVVMHLVNELQEVQNGPELAQILDRCPAAAQVYENLNYQYAGLCRSALDASLSAEQLARKAIDRARQKLLTDPPHGRD